MDRKIEKKKWTPKKIIGISAGVIIVGFIIYTIFFGDHSSKLNVREERITISTVTKGPFQEFIPVTGTVIPIKTIYLDAMEGGRVDKKFVEAGTYVNKGDKILQLGNTNLLMDIMYREAELFQQSNNLRNTRLAMQQNTLALKAQLLEVNYQIQQQKRVYDKQTELYKKNLVSEQEWEEARDRYDYLIKNRELTLLSHKQDSIFQETQISQLEMGLKRMEANLEIVKQNLENLTVKAPVTGQLTSLNAEIGESKTRGQRLGQIDVLDGFKIRVRVDEYYLARIDIGQKGEFSFAGETYQMAIDKIYPEVLNGRFEVDMLFEGEEPDGIRRGQTVHIRLELGDLSEAILLDKGGFYQKTGGQWVYVIDPSGDFAVKRDIRIGRMNPEVFEVLEGLEPGERVITSSYESYGDIDKLILKK
ncbi:MAG: HlyD family efflux transporter periplasmic adaptor subunit [Candidatus Marinimicrobia bacterium]|nr:HlyD family efflux transporter periplasmic adaptor subunit [Candidatus Neomarinimicrobiota bacterium]